MKRLRYLSNYRKLLKKHKETLLNSRINGNTVGIRYDWLFRLYTVLNLPLNDDDNMKKYGYYYINNMVKNHIAQMNEFLLHLGLLEYLRIDTNNVVQIDEYNVKIVLRFKWINLKLLFRILIIGLPIAIILTIILLFVIL